MCKPNPSRYGLFTIIGLTFALLLSPSLVLAKYIGGEPPRDACQTCKCDSSACSTAETCPYCSSTTSRTEGTQSQTYGVDGARSANGPTLGLTLTYDTYNADGSHAVIETVQGKGWTHLYNIFLFSQRGHMFRMDGSGRTTKYQLGPGGTFAAATGYFETLVKNPDGSFTLTQKDKTIFHFALIPNTPFLVGGPVFRLTSIVDRNNNLTTFNYSSGNLSSITDTYGRSLNLTYTGQNKLATVTDPLGRITTFQYDPTGRQLVRITDPAGRSVQYTYNFMYQITRKVDKDGRVFNYDYSNGKPVAVKDGVGNTLHSFTNPTNWATNDTVLARDLVREYVPSTTNKTDGRGNIWRYEYDTNGYLTRIVAPDGAATRDTYDPATLKVATATDANNHTTTYQYDPQGNRTQMTDALGFVTTYTYEPVFNQMTSMTDANGRTTTYQYDARGNRIRETDPLLQTREWTYDSHGNVLSEKDKRNNTTTYLYDASGNRIQKTDPAPLSYVTTMTYDAVGNLITRTDPNAHVTQYQYDGLNRLVRETKPLGDPLQADTRFFYDGQGNRVRVIDRELHATIYQYDLRRRLIQTTDALPPPNNVTTFTYDGNDNRVSMTDKNHHTTTMQYDVQNRQTRTTDAQGKINRMTYDAVGNKLSETDANNHTTTYTYDELNRRTQSSDAVGNVTTMFYDSTGPCVGCTGPTRGSAKPSKITDGNGKVTYFKYDGLDRLVRQVRKQTDTADIEDADDAVTRYSYDANNNRLTLTEPNGNTMTYVYDALNRQITVTNAAGDVTTMTYDGVGNVISMTAPNGNLTNHTYDALDRRTQTTDSAGVVSSTTYDAVGNRLTQADGNGNTTAYAYDAIYRVIQMTDPLGHSSSYSYDAVGNLLTVTDREARVTTYLYDAINRRTRMTDALSNVTQYQYDGVGNRTRITDANSHQTNYAYDGVNRLIRETYADGRNVTYVYDFVGNRTSRTDQKGQVTTYSYSDLYFLTQRTYPLSPADNMTYDLSGRMLSAERGGWLVTFSYDGANRVLQTTQNGKIVNYIYNVPGRTRMVTYPGGRTLTEHTDFRSRLGSIDDASPNLVQYAYDAGNRVLTRTYRNGTQAAYSYNANDWIVSLEHSLGATRIAGFGYDHDKEGNKKFEEKRTDSASSNLKSEAYQYDAIYRLVDYKVGTLSGSTVPLPTTQTQYTLDGVGNWNVKTQDAVPENRSHSVTNEIASINGAPVASDFNGNMTEDTRYRDAYDEENRLVRVTRKADSRIVGQYQYDALSRRVVGRTNPASTLAETRFFYDDARIIEEQDAVGVTKATYVYGNYIDEVLTMDRGGTFYYHQNSLWSVEAITDSAAAVVERYAYDAYGCATITNGSGVPIPPNAWGTAHSAIANPYLFTGRELDEETGLYYYRARYYDCVKGRFLQRDPLGYVDGMNLYEYVRSRPTFAMDPSGMAICYCFVADPPYPTVPCGYSNQGATTTTSANGACGGNLWGLFNARCCGHNCGLSRGWTCTWERTSLFSANSRPVWSGDLFTSWTPACPEAF